MRVSITTFWFLMFSVLVLLFLIYRESLKNANKLGKGKRTIQWIFSSYLVYLGIEGFIAYKRIFISYLSFPPPAIFPLLIIPTIAFFLFWKFTEFKNLLLEVSLEKLTLFQMYRFVPEILILLLINESLMPSVMTFTGRNFDVLIPLTSPFLYYLSFVVFSKNINLQKNTLLIWNFLGIMILSNTIITGMLSLPTPMQEFGFDLPNTIVMEFPVYLLPGFLVPIAFAIHGLSIYKILNAKS